METKETVMYIGPSFKGGKLCRGTLFIGGIPEFLKPDLSKYPGIEYLFVAVSDIAEKEKLLAEQGSALAVIARRVMEGEQKNA